MSDRGFLTDAVQWGTRDGGAFEIPAIAVFELGEQGKLYRLDLYDPAQLDQARARASTRLVRARRRIPYASRPTRRRGQTIAGGRTPKPRIGTPCTRSPQGWCSRTDAA